MKLRVLSLIVLFCIGSFLFSSYKQHNTSAEGSIAAKKVREKYVADIAQFHLSVKELDQSIADLQPGLKTRQVIEKNFFTCREKYKRFEFLAAYSDPDFDKFFNGANLPKLDNNILSFEIIDPKGLQVIEELIFGDSLFQNKKTLQKLCYELEGNAITLKSTAEKLYFSDRMILEACRKEVIRVTSLGLTGFDSPVCKNSIPEALTAFETIAGALQNYNTFLEEKSPEIKKALEFKLKESIAYLKKNQDFDTFDRLHFLKDFANPIYGLILKAHKAMGIETIHEATLFNQPVNYYADNIFSESLLNPYYYGKAKINEADPRITELGRLLFFDPVLSINNKLSCASCHQPEKAFTDGVQKSATINGEGTVDRNSPTLINAAIQASLFYDVRAKSVDDQIDHVVFNAKEFDTNFESIIAKLNGSSTYVKLFREAFPKNIPNPIDGFTLNSALADYVRSLVAMDSEFDKYVRGEKETISPAVKNGFNLFMGKAQCGTCHFAPAFNGTVPPDFVDAETEVLGVPASNDTLNPVLDKDPGKYNFRRSPIYEHAFKTATVRNVKLTAPYMHNGAFNTLEEVLDFYNRGGGLGLKLDVPNQTLPEDRLNLTKQEMNDITAFMNSLTDTTGTTAVPKVFPEFESDPKLNARSIEY